MTDVPIKDSPKEEWKEVEVARRNRRTEPTKPPQGWAGAAGRRSSAGGGSLRHRFVHAPDSTFITPGAGTASGQGTVSSGNPAGVSLVARTSACEFRGLSRRRNKSRRPQRRRSALPLQSDPLGPRRLHQVAIECGQLDPVPSGQLQVSGVIHGKLMRPGQAQHFAFLRREVQSYR
jgi:hypothetical protein